jgi:hypothetical protein
MRLTRNFERRSSWLSQQRAKTTHLVVLWTLGRYGFLRLVAYLFINGTNVTTIDIGGVFSLGHLLIEPELTNVRAALSEPFNHSPTDYDYVAGRLKGVDPAVLYEIFYSEVAPVCFTNIAAVLPTVGTGFDPEWLRAEIELRLAARRRNWLRRQFDRLLVRWLEYNYDYMWKEIACKL